MRTPKLFPILALSALAVSLVSCAPDDAGGGGSDDKPHDKLSIALAQAGPDFGLILLAEEEGFYDEAGLDVTIQYGPPNSFMASLVSGQVDLAAGATGSGLAAVDQGGDIRMIYGLTAPYGQALLARPDITTVEKAQALEDCTIAVPAPGTGSYTFAALFIQELGLNCEIIAAASPALLGTGVVNSTFDFSVQPLTQALTTVSQGGVLLQDPREEEFKKMYLPATPFPQTFIIGVGPVLEKKRDAVSRFLGALTKAQELGTTYPISDLVDILLANPQFAGQTAEDMTLALELITPTYNFAFGDGPVGYIGPEAWQAAVDRTVVSGIPGFDPTDPEYAYDKRVDSSFVTQ